MSCEQKTIKEAIYSEQNCVSLCLQEFYQAKGNAMQICGRALRNHYFTMSYLQSSAVIGNCFVFFLTDLARNTSNDTKNGQKMPPLLSFQDLFIHFYSLILTILWLCFFQGVHQSADSFQDKDNLCHLLPKMKNNKGLAQLQRHGSRRKVEEANSEGESQ